jgi:hypothetical protein
MSKKQIRNFILIGLATIAIILIPSGMAYAGADVVGNI